MGLSTTIASLITLYVLLITIVVFGAVIIKGVQVINNVLLKDLRIERSEVRIVSAKVFDYGSVKGVEVNITNIGNKMIYDFTHCDLIVSYTSLGVHNVIEGKFSKSLTTEPYYWYIVWIEIPGGYLVEYQYPRALMPSETAIIHINLPEVPDINTTVTITFATPDGSKSYYEFYYSG